MDAADLDAASGDALQFGDEAAADQRLEGIRIDVDQQADSAKHAGRGNEEQIFPPAAAGGLGGGFGHCDWTPGSLAEGVTPGM